MNIAIDCRYIGKSGIGRVCEGILDNLDYTQNTYFLIGKRENLEKYQPANIIEDNTEPYTIKGILSFDKNINKICDALIIPNFLIPLNVKIPTYTIMHDLAFLDVKETTKGFIDKQLKKYLLKRCMKKSKKIACVSNFTRSRCEHFYGELSKKCYTNYVGLSNTILNANVNGIEKNNVIVFVGNVKPHKGLRTLIESYKKLQNTDYKLKIIGEKDNFAVKLDTEDINVDGVEFTGKLSNFELVKEIASAKLLVQPSIYEGFGAPPLEALYLGTKPIISDIEVFNEIYSDFDVDFFKCNDTSDLTRKIQSANTLVSDQKQKILEKYNYSKFTKILLEKLFLEKQNENIS